MTVNFSLSVFETSTEAGSAERLEAPVVAALLAEIDQHLALALQQLLDRLDDAGGADLFVLVGGEGAAQPEGVERRPSRVEKICAPMIEASHMVQAPAISDSSRGWSGV